MRTEPGSIHTPRRAVPSGALPCPAERRQPVREDAGRRWGGRRAVFRPLLRRAAYACGKGVILRCKAVQHAKNRADVRETEGTGKSGYRGEAVRTIILGAVRARTVCVWGDCRCAGRMHGKAQAGRQGAGSMDGQGQQVGMVHFLFGRALRKAAVRHSRAKARRPCPQAMRAASKIPKRAYKTESGALPRRQGPGWKAGAFCVWAVRRARASARGGLVPAAAHRKPVRPGGYVPLCGLAGKRCEAK